MDTDVWLSKKSQTAPEIWHQKLRAARLRPTVTRLSLLDVLNAQQGRALTCDEIYRLLITTGFGGNLSSIYSNARTLAEAGVLVRGEPTKIRARLCTTYQLSPTIIDANTF